MYKLPEVEFKTWMDQNLYLRMREEFEKKYYTLWNFAHENGTVIGFEEEPNAE